MKQKKYLYIILVVLISVLIQSCNSYRYDKRDRWIDHQYRNLSYIDTSKLDILAKNHIIDASIYKIKYDYAMAIIEFEQALRYDTSASILYAIAECFNNLQKYDYARDYAIKAINEERDFLPAYEILSRAYLKVNDIKNAILTLENALSMSENEQYTFYLARLYEYQNIEKSKQYYNILIERYSNYDAYDRLVEIYKTDRDTNNYFKLIKDYWAKYPADYSIVIDIMQFSFETKHYDTIFNNIELIDDNLSLDELENIYCWIISKMTELLKINPQEFSPNDISAIILKINERFNNSILINMNAGELLLAVDKDTTRASKYLQNIINTPNLEENIYIRCSMAYDDYGYTDLAINALDKAIKFTPYNQLLLEKRNMLKAKISNK